MPAARRKTTSKVDPEKLDPSGANEGREERAELIEAANEADAVAAKADQEKADELAKVSDEVPAHVVKRDDEGAKEQQEAAQENALPIKAAEYDGPPVVAPVIESGLGKATLEIHSRDTGEEITDDVLFAGLHARVLGEGYPFPGEVIIDIRKEDGQDHQRFSTFTYTGAIDVDLGGISGPGTWVVHAESPITQVGEGRDDHLPVIRESDEVTLVVR